MQTGRTIPCGAAQEGSIHILQSKPRVALQIFIRQIKSISCSLDSYKQMLSNISFKSINQRIHIWMDGLIWVYPRVWKTWECNEISSSLGYWPHIPSLPSTILAFEQDLLGFATKQTSLRSFHFWIFLMKHWQSIPLQSKDQTSPVSPVQNGIAHAF